MDKKSGNNIEIPLINNDFENDSIKPWLVSNLSDAAKIKITSNKFSSGSKSLVLKGVVYDQTIVLNNYYAGKDYPEK